MNNCSIIVILSYLYLFIFLLEFYMHMLQNTETIIKQVCMLEIDVKAHSAFISQKVI